MRAKNGNLPEEKFPPAFWSLPTAADLTVLAAMQRGRRFDPSLVFAVAARCSHGFPQVTVCSPLTSDGSPFPTLFWLSCPYLMKKCAELESRQLIAELEKVFAEMPEKIHELHSRYAALRELVLRTAPGSKGERETARALELMKNGGVGGINWREGPSAVKCLHLQTATMLGLGWHPAASWLRGKIGEFECGVCICAEFENISTTH
jgi:hypothetical protein